MKRSDLLTALNNHKVRSAWDKGVKEYAIEIVENNSEENDDITSVDDVLNYARDKHESLFSIAQMQSHGGCFDIYDEVIAEQLCSPSEFKRAHYKDGSIKQMANARESWLDVQGRAIYQAYVLINAKLHRIDLR